MSDIVNKKLLKFCEISKNSGLDIQYKSNIKEKFGKSLFSYQLTVVSQR